MRALGEIQKVWRHITDFQSDSSQTPCQENTSFMKLHSAITINNVHKIKNILDKYQLILSIKLTLLSGKINWKQTFDNKEDNLFREQNSLTLKGGMFNKFGLITVQQNVLDQLS